MAKIKKKMFEINYKIKYFKTPFVYKNISLKLLKINNNIDWFFSFQFQFLKYIQILVKYFGILIRNTVCQ